MHVLHCIGVFMLVKMCVKRFRENGHFQKSDIKRRRAFLPRFRGGIRLLLLRARRGAGERRRDGSQGVTGCARNGGRKRGKKYYIFFFSHAYIHTYVRTYDIHNNILYTCIKKTINIL